MVIIYAWLSVTWLNFCFSCFGYAGMFFSRGVNWFFSELTVGSREVIFIVWRLGHCKSLLWCKVSGTHWQRPCNSRSRASESAKIMDFYPRRFKTNIVRTRQFFEYGGMACSFKRINLAWFVSRWDVCFLSFVHWIGQRLALLSSFETFPKSTVCFWVLFVIGYVLSLSSVIDWISVSDCVANWAMISFIHLSTSLEGNRRPSS